MTQEPDDIKEQVDYSKIRKHVRYKVTSPCRLFVADSEVAIESHLTSISVAGVSFIYHEILPCGTILRIEFDLPNGTKVNKNVEVRRFEKKLEEFKVDDFKTIKGFEHGSKFVVTSSVPDSASEQNAVAPVVPEEEVFKTGLFHLEFYRQRGNVLRHAYVSKYSAKHLYFSCLNDLTLNETLKVNFVVIDEETFSQETFAVKILEANREGRLFNYKGQKLI